MEDKKIQTGISLYELNKMAMRQLPPQSKNKLKTNLTSIGTWFGTFESNKNWFMLLCREKADYTVFHLINHNYVNAVKELKECIEDRGQLFAIEYVHGENAYEIWIRDVETRDVSMYMLFNCTPMIIEV